MLLGGNILADRQREQARLRKQRQRDKERGDSVTLDSVTLERDMVPASYVEGFNGRTYESLPARPRFLTLSDGQVLDRGNQPIARFYQWMRTCNKARYNFHPLKGTLTEEVRSKLNKKR